MFEIPSGLVTATMAYVTGFLAQTEVLAIMGILIAIPLGFWAIKKLKSLFMK